MTERELFILADQTLFNVVSQIKDNQWDMLMPDWFKVGRTQNSPDLREIIIYHAYDDAWVPDVLAGRTATEVGDKFDGDLLGADPKASFGRIVQSAVDAVSSLNDPNKVVHLSYGDYPAREYLQHISYFRGLRARDISKVIGIDAALPAPLVQGLWGMIAPQAENWRAMGVFDPAVPVPSDAPLQDRLVALTGRQP